MKKFWIIDGSCEEYTTKDEAVAAAKRRAAFLAKNPPQSYPFCLQNVDDDTVYVYEAVAIARTPTPNIEVEEIS